MARTRIGRAIGDIARRAARGEMTAAQAAALIARLRHQQTEQVYRAALDAAAGGGPVAVRLIGPTADVATVLAAMDEVTTLTDVSEPYPTTRPGQVRVYATAARRHPISGGSR